MINQRIFRKLTNWRVSEPVRLSTYSMVATLIPPKKNDIMFFFLLRKINLLVYFSFSYQFFVFCKVKLNLEVNSAFVPEN